MPTNQGHPLGVTDTPEPRSARQTINDMLDAVTGPPARDSVELAEMTLAAINGELVKAIHIPGVDALSVLQVLARRFHGDAVSDDLGIPRHDVTDSLLTPVISVIRSPAKVSTCSTVGRCAPRSSSQL